MSIRRKPGSTLDEHVCDMIRDASRTLTEAADLIEGNGADAMNDSTPFALDRLRERVQYLGRVMAKNPSLFLDWKAALFPTASKT